MKFCPIGSPDGVYLCALTEHHDGPHRNGVGTSPRILSWWVGEPTTEAAREEVRTRPTRDAYFLAGAEWASARAECRRRKVGALIVDADGHVRGHGYNGALPGMRSCLDGACPRGLKSYEEKAHATDYSDCIADHAERNAIRNTDPRHVVGSVLYSSCRPCPSCWTLIRSVQIARVVWPDGEETL